MDSIQESFGNIDIYLFDQILKRRFEGSKSVLDAGCGGGRNLVYFLRNGFEVFGLDPREEAIVVVRELCSSIAPNNPVENFQLGTIEHNPFDGRQFDVVVCNAVLHFAENEAHFRQMLNGLWDGLAPGGFLFIRLASKLGIENKIQPLGNGRFLLPDGTERYLVDDRMLLDLQAELGALQMEPIKTTCVQDLRSMTTWCLGKETLK